MKIKISYVVAAVVLVGLGGWMATGALVTGGQGPGKGIGSVKVLLGLQTEQEAEDEARIQAAQQVIKTTRDAEDSVIADARKEEDGKLADARKQADASSTAATEDAAAEEPEVTYERVRTELFTAAQMPVVVALRGQTQANLKVTVRAETTGVLLERHVEKGARVTKGDVLCSLDQGTRGATVTQAQAALKRASSDLAANVALRKDGLATRNSGIALESSVAAAKTALQQAEFAITQTIVRAGSDGIVQAPMAEVGDMISAGGVCVTLVQLNPMKFVGDVSERKVALLKTGMPAQIKTVTGQEIIGRVKYIANVANQATRSFEVEIEFDNSDGLVRDGVTSQAFISPASVAAHFLPQSVLTLDDDGVIGVRGIVEDDLVAFYPIEILRDTPDGMWVAGLPDQALIITVGQEYVLAGEKVIFNTNKS